MDYIVKDSSIWKNSQHHSLLNNTTYSIRVGMVREHMFFDDSSETRYVVEVWKNNRLYPMTCVRANSRFGGIFNYEEYTHRGFNPGKTNVSLGNFQFVPGDTVIVAAADGNSREGFILSSINHFGRPERIPANEETAYASEFNGLQKVIAYSGGYTVTFNGTPTNIDKLKEAPTGEDLPLPEYNSTIAGSYYQFDKNGSFTICDNEEQSILVDKPSGKIVIASGSTLLTIDKSAESLSITNKKSTFDSTNEFNISTKKVSIDAQSLVDIKASDIKIDGKIDQKGKVKIDGDTKIKGNVDVTGNFSTTGETLLAGGANPLIYDILLTIGTGNLGAPVISSNIVLKTVQTKAT